MLDIDQINSLTDDQKAAYMRHEKTFESDGWPDVVEWAQRMADYQAARSLSATTWEETNQARGARAAFLAVVTLREQTEAEFAHLAAEAKEDALVSDETGYE